MSFGQRPVMVVPNFGRIEFFAHYWKGAVRLAPFNREFKILVRARRDGPSAQQSMAMSRLVSDFTAIYHAATGPMLALHREVARVVNDESIVGDDVWSLLIPEAIEVADAGYYGDERIAILVAFASSLHPDFSPAIQTVDGRFVQILDGT